MDEGTKNSLKALVQGIFDGGGSNYTGSLTQTDIDTIKTGIDGLLDNTSVDDFFIGADEVTKAHVASKLPSLTTDDQKLVVVVAIQSL